MTWVLVEELSNKLDGRSRPGHFRGVTTVVSKLFHIVEPDMAFFGQKDAAQVAIIRRMVRDLNLPVEITRLPDRARARRSGHEFPQRLSRSRAEKEALVLHRSLTAGAGTDRTGGNLCHTLASAGRQEFAAEPSVRLDYFEIVNPDTLDPIEDISNGALIAVAAYVGSTRLIDNLLIKR